MIPDTIDSSRPPAFLARSVPPLNLLKAVMIALAAHRHRELDFLGSELPLFLFQ